MSSLIISLGFWSIRNLVLNILSSLLAILLDVWFNILKLCRSRLSFNRTIVRKLFSRGLFHYFLLLIVINSLHSSFINFISTIIRKLICFYIYTIHICIVLTSQVLSTFWFILRLLTLKVIINIFLGHFCMFFFYIRLDVLITCNYFILHLKFCFILTENITFILINRKVSRRIWLNVLICSVWLIIIIINLFMFYYFSIIRYYVKAIILMRLK
jgi:hypothetical protein